MNSKTVTTLLLAMLAVLTLTMAGCANLFGSDDDDNGGGGGGLVFDGQINEAEIQYDGSTTTVQVVTGRFKDDLTWTSDNIYVLNGPVFIGNNAQDPSNATGNTLTIEQGTLILGDTDQTTPGVLIITRGSKINAQGTETDPIVFTSLKDPGDRAAGDWGGVIVNGYAQVQGGYAEGEGGTGEYGGGENPIDGDDSGTLKYVIAQFAGTLFSADNELNTFVMQGVGSGTTLEYLQAHRGADDGIEFFGGSVQLKYYVGTGIQDDALDGDDGWNGSVQYAILQGYDDDAGSIIEADGDADDVFAASNAIMANITGIAGSATSAGFDFKSDANYDVYNSVMDMQEADTQAPYADKGGATIEYFGTLVVGGDNSGSDSDNADLETPNNGNELRDSGSGIENAVATETAGEWTTDFDETPTAGTFAPATIPDTDPADNALDDTNYIGAYDGSNKWWEGWIDTPVN